MLPLFFTEVTVQSKCMVPVSLALLIVIPVDGNTVILKRLLLPRDQAIHLETGDDFHFRLGFLDRVFHNKSTKSTSALVNFSPREKT